MQTRFFTASGFSRRRNFRRANPPLSDPVQGLNLRLADVPGTAVRAAADKLYEALLAAGIDVILDDRGERPGVMFADWELIGVPHRLVIGERGLKEGKIEYQGRRDTQAQLLDAADVAEIVAGKVRAAKAV